MQIIRSFIRKNIVDPIVDNIQPHAYRFYKSRRPRDENSYHYRYPSPANYPIDRSESHKNLDYRVPYKDSVYDIKNTFRTKKEDPIQVFVTNGISANMQKDTESKVISHQE